MGNRLSLSVVTAVCGAATTSQWIHETLGIMAQPRQVCVAFNGCTTREIAGVAEEMTSAHESCTFYINPEPLGAAAFNRIVPLATGAIVALLHNVLMLRDYGWDAAIETFFEQHPAAGVVGFAGARQLGRDDIYRSAYQLPQLARADVWSSLTDWPVHGRHAVEPVEVAVLDGLALCLTRDLWDRLGGFDEGLGPWHLYDIDLSLRAREAGFRNYVLPISCRHLSGQTAGNARYVRRFGSDAEVHCQAHENFYRKYLNRLPVRV